jgi:hypothetical protein
MSLVTSSIKIQIGYQVGFAARGENVDHLLQFQIQLQIDGALETFQSDSVGSFCFGNNIGQPIGAGNGA